MCQSFFLVFLAAFVAVAPGFRVAIDSPDSLFGTEVFRDEGLPDRGFPLEPEAPGVPPLIGPHSSEEPSPHPTAALWVGQAVDADADAVASSGIETLTPLIVRGAHDAVETLGPATPVVPAPALGAAGTTPFVVRHSDVDPRSARPFVPVTAKTHAVAVAGKQFASSPAATDTSESSGLLEDQPNAVAASAAHVISTTPHQTGFPLAVADLLEESSLPEESSRDMADVVPGAPPSLIETKDRQVPGSQQVTGEGWTNGWQSVQRRTGLTMERQVGIAIFFVLFFGCACYCSSGASGGGHKSKERRAGRGGARDVRGKGGGSLGGTEDSDSGSGSGMTEAHLRGDGRDSVFSSASSNKSPRDSAERLLAGVKALARDLEGPAQRNGKGGLSSLVGGFGGLKSCHVVALPRPSQESRDRRTSESEMARWRGGCLGWWESKEEYKNNGRPKGYVMLGKIADVNLEAKDKMLVVIEHRDQDTTRDLELTLPTAKLAKRFESSLRDLLSKLNGQDL